MSLRKVPALAPGLLVALCAGSAPADSIVLRSPAFGIVDADDGTSSLVAFDDAGGIRASLASPDAELRFGSRHVAVVRRAVSGGERSVELFSTALETVARFAMPFDRDLVVGASSVALLPRAIHQPGVAFELEFRRSTGVGAGAPAAVVALPGRTLATLTAQPDGSFVATSRTADGVAYVEAFTEGGAISWSRSRPASPSAPIVSIAPNGQHAVVAFADRDGVSLRCEVVDASGRTLREFVAEPFGAIVYDDPGARAALIGSTSVVVIDATTGTRLFEGRPSHPPLAGNGVAFSGDGSHLLIAERRTALPGGVGHLVIELLPLLPGGGSERSIELSSVAIDDGACALALRDRGDAGLRIVTSAGAWNLEK